LRRLALALAGLVVLGAVAAVLVFRDWGPAPVQGVVFEAKVDRVYQLFRINPDGSGLKQLTHLKFPRRTTAGDALLAPLDDAVTGVGHAVWSPDAKRIAFATDYGRTKYRVISLYTIKPDGTELEQLPIRLGRFTVAPAYSPDGKLLSFDWYASAEPVPQQGIVIASVDGTRIRRLTRIEQPSAVVKRSNWSPDGRWLVFTQFSGPDQSVIVRMRPDGTGRRELTPWALNANNAKWSPDGSRIAFNSYNDPNTGESANILTMKPDGSDVVQLTHYKGGRRNAHLGGWSPDGRQLVVHIRGSDADRPEVNQIFVVNADGSGIRQLTHMLRGANPRYPSWSPAG